MDRGAYQATVHAVAESDTTEQLNNNTADPWASQVMLVVKNPPAKAGDGRDVGLTPGSGRSPGGGYIFMTLFANGAIVHMGPKRMAILGCSKVSVTPNPVLMLGV